MASGDSDQIEVMDSSLTRNKENTTGTSTSDDDDRDRTSIAEKNVPYDPAVGPLGAISKIHKSDRKIGHRRVGEGGEITYKKIQSSQIMGSIQLGIQHAIGGLASKPERDLLMQDFMTVETTNFPHEGSNHTPAHHYSEFKFKTYAPIAFRYFRDLFGIQPDDFLMSMCSAPLRELSNPGASGSIFYLTNDDEFIIKTVMHKEGEFLQKLLPGYYLNLDQNPRTLLPKFFGLYCYQCNSKNVRLVAMNNILPSSVKLHQKYDLKGSTYKRKANKSERQKSSPTYKDLDFMEHHSEGIFLEADTYNALIKTMQRDCRVLESFKIMDYSLLVGIHNLDEAAREKLEARNKEAEEGTGGATDGEPKKSGLNRTRSINRQRLVAHSTAMESIQAESEPIDEEEDVPPGGIPARNARGERLLLFLGIIDILQSYRLRKKLEHTWKSMIHDGDTVSVHRPSFYAQRFLDFMAKTVFKKIPSSLKHSPSKRKSIAKPARTQEDIENAGRIGRPIKDYNPDYMRNRSPRSSVRSSMSDFTDTTISTWNQRHVPKPQPPTEYPSVLSDRLKNIDRDRTFPRRIDFDSNLPGTSYGENVYRASLRERQESLSDQLTKVLSVGAGSSHINGSLADSGIQTDNTSTSVPQIYIAETQTSPLVVKILKDAAVDTRNENNLQDIPFIDDDEDDRFKRKYILEKHKSMSNIPEKIDEDSKEIERLSSSFNRSKSPTFVEKFKQFFVDIGLVKNDSLPNIKTDDIALQTQTLPKNITRTRSVTPTSLEIRDSSTLPKDMRFRKVRSTQTVYIRQESPILLNKGTQSKEHVSVVKLNGEEYIKDSSERVLKEIVYIESTDTKEAGTSHEIHKIPFENTSPTKNLPSPTKITTSPAQITTSPTQITTIPTQILRYIKSTDTKEAGTSHDIHKFPIENTSPTKNLHKPTKIITSPAQITTSPTKITTSPAQITTSPTQITTTPTQILSKPTEIITSSIEIHGSGSTIIILPPAD